MLGRIDRKHACRDKQQLALSCYTCIVFKDFRIVREDAAWIFIKINLAESIELVLSVKKVMLCVALVYLVSLYIIYWFLVSGSFTYSWVAKIFALQHLFQCHRYNWRVSECHGPLNQPLLLKPSICCNYCSTLRCYIRDCFVHIVIACNWTVIQAVSIQLIFKPFKTVYPRICEFKVNQV